MDLQLKDKVAIVGGGSDGIGLGIATALAREGARVAISARREAGLSKAKEKIGGAVLAIPADCRNAEDCKRVIDTAAAHFGGIDILVNNDGAPPLGGLAGFDDAAWHKAIEQNLLYAVRMARGVLPHMDKRGGGSILNITAISAIQPIKGFGLSVATWAGVIGFAKTLSIEVAPMNVSVNTICPGYIETSRLQKVFTEPDARARLIAEIPMGRIGSVEDIANLVAYLVSPLGRYVTGTAIQVDGGLLRALR